MTLHSLPLFPLGTVLFPDGELPLRIFEVRYLDMINKCVKADAPFGIVSLVQGEEVRRPEIQELFSSVGTLAKISHHQSPQSGLKLVVCQGSSRFRITHTERLKHGLWIADVDFIDNDMPVAVPAELSNTVDALVRVHAQLSAVDQHAVPKPPFSALQLNDCGWIANRWCELLPLQQEFKQRMLELENPLIRLELVNDILDKYQIV